MRAPGPFSVFEKVIFCDDADVSIVVAADKLAARRNETDPAAVIDPARELEPAPFCVSEEASEQIALDVRVNMPAFVTVRGPLPVVVSVLLMVKADPVNTTPAGMFVLIGPFKVVVPVPAA